MNILIVDRSPFVSPSIREMLGNSREGVSIREAAGYSDALYLLKEIPFDMLVYDFSLPERIKLSLLRYVRYRYPCTKMVPFHKERKIFPPKSSPENQN
jgi:DNA-binding NarL/FixJ family response regulator